MVDVCRRGFLTLEVDTSFASPKVNRVLVGIAVAGKVGARRAVKLVRKGGFYIGPSVQVVVIPTVSEFSLCLCGLQACS